jgi:hypothetical protein
MRVKDSTGIKLDAALTSVSSGANDTSFDKNLAVSIPPWFLLYEMH